MAKAAGCSGSTGIAPAAGRRAGRVAWVAAAADCASGPPAIKRWAASPAGVLGLSGSATALSAVRRAYPAGVRGPGRRLTHTPALYVLSRQGREEILTLAAPAAPQGLCAEQRPRKRKQAV